MYYPAHVAALQSPPYVKLRAASPTHGGASGPGPAGGPAGGGVPLFSLSANYGPSGLQSATHAEVERGVGEGSGGGNGSGSGHGSGDGVGDGGSAHGNGSGNGNANASGSGNGSLAAAQALLRAELKLSRDEQATISAHLLSSHFGEGGSAPPSAPPSPTLQRPPQNFRPAATTAAAGSFQEYLGEKSDAIVNLAAIVNPAAAAAVEGLVQAGPVPKNDSQAITDTGATRKVPKELREELSLARLEAEGLRKELSSLKQDLASLKREEGLSHQNARETERLSEDYFKRVAGEAAQERDEALAEFLLSIFILLPTSTHLNPPPPATGGRCEGGGGGVRGDGGDGGEQGGGGHCARRGVGTQGLARK
ncbi:hypothetical protein T492DRAFT_846639 [Pavlovales sp. CCMP2436]|nr:hypothetical protein T492DRAFT_846639 [Pavlovales sp. CCMP2436]